MKTLQLYLAINIDSQGKADVKYVYTNFTDEYASRFSIEKLKRMALEDMIEFLIPHVKITETNPEVIQELLAGGNERGL